MRRAQILPSEFTPEPIWRTQARTLSGVLVFYFLLDMVALTTPAKSALDIGQSVPLLMAMYLYMGGEFHPLDTPEKRGDATLWAVIVWGSTILDAIDVAYNSDTSEPYTLYPPLVDMALSVVFLCRIHRDLALAQNVFQNVQQQRAEPGANPPVSLEVEA